jgi:hypothetical protein
MKLSGLERYRRRSCPEPVEVLPIKDKQRIKEMN